jgi:hypothetical protein
MADILIIRSKVDLETQWRYWLGDGLKQYLKSKGFSVKDLSDADASPENVSKWLNFGSQNVTKAIIAFGHGKEDILFGEKNGNNEAVIDKSNAANLTKELHVYAFAGRTNATNGLGQFAVQNGCYSWLDYTGSPWILMSADQTFKDCIWSYIVTLAEGKTLEECEAALIKAYKDRASLHWVYVENLKLLMLRKSQNGMRINTHNRITGWRYNRKIDCLWSYGTATRWTWVHVQNYFWRLVWNVFDSQAEVLAMMFAHAKNDDKFVSFYEDNGVIKEMYVW